MNRWELCADLQMCLITAVLRKAAGLGCLLPCNQGKRCETQNSDISQQLRLLRSVSWCVTQQWRQPLLHHSRSLLYRRLKVHLSCKEDSTAFCVQNKNEVTFLRPVLSLLQTRTRTGNCNSESNSGRVGSISIIWVIPSVPKRFFSTDLCQR